MKDNPSDRVVHQRARNRIMEAVETLADGDEGVRAVSFVEYFCMFYDVVPHRNKGPMHRNTAVTDEERGVLLEVSSIVDDACDDTPSDMSEDAFIATGWPKRIQPVAMQALALMRKRGRFSEDHEEDLPASGL